MWPVLTLKISNEDEIVLSEHEDASLRTMYWIICKLLKRVYYNHKYSIMALKRV